MENAIMAIMVWGTLGHRCHSYFLNVLYNFGFPRGALWSRPPWRFWFSQCPMGPKELRRPSAPSARRNPLVSRPHKQPPAG